MMLGLVWGAPDLRHRGDHQGVDRVRSRKLRIAPVLVPVAALLIVGGATAPGAIGADGPGQLEFVTQPADALVGQTITGAPLDPSQSFVQVKAETGDGNPISGIKITFDLAGNTGQPPGSLTVVPQTTNASGIATFGAGTLSIGAANEPQFTDYQLAPRSLPTTAVPELIGAASSGFDVWEAGCEGNNCSIGLRNGLDAYKTSENTILVGSSLPGAVLPNLECPDQKLIFASEVFVHATTGSGAVLLTSHITGADFRAAGTNFGQAHVEWCVGLKTTAPWVKNGAPFTQQDTNDDGLLDLYVGSAPKCPKKNAASFAPCIVSHRSDGQQGSLTTGWLPGGDPPRRT
jgi:hypothetical protein